MKNNFIKKSLESEMIESYLNYSTEVIIGRAIPDVRDGLKPVHRRIIYSMYNLKSFWNKSYKKSARIVGDVIGKYHPHGDLSVYEAIVRMCQKFTSRYNLLDGQGNFGSIDGDNAAAMRYTEIRLSRIGCKLLKDLEKNTVNFCDNYDNTEKQPVVFPAQFPNLLINGTCGIAVGISSSIPPHNLTEVINGCIYLLNNKNCEIYELNRFIKGPDFPSRGILIKKENIIKIYKTGKGSVTIRAKLHIEETNDGENKILIITELPYLLNKNIIIDKLLNLIKKEVFPEILHIKDESNKIGIRIILFLKLNINIFSLIEKLYKFSPLEQIYNINMIALVKDRPRLLNLKEILKEFLKHRKIVLKKNLIFKIKKFINLCIYTETFIIAIENINEIINIIKNSKTKDNISTNLFKIKLTSTTINEVIKINKINKKYIKVKNTRLLKNLYCFNENLKFKLTKNQINIILNLKLQKLNNEQKSLLEKKYKYAIENLIKLIIIINNSKKLKRILIKNLQKIKITCSDKRKTKIQF